MCWVMPPASPAATSVSRIASSSEVLPWSTWPMIVTTGGRSARSSSASENSGSSGSSSAAVTISSLRSYSSAIARIDSSVRVWVRVAISPIIISFLITSAGARPSDSATSRTVAPELTLVASGSTGVSGPSGGSSSSGRRRRPRGGAAGAAAAGRPSGRGGRPASRSRRGVFSGAAAAAAALLGGRPGAPVCSKCGAFGGCRGRRFCARRGRRLSAARSGAAAAGCGWAALRRPAAPCAAVALGGGDRLQRVSLLDARGGGFRLDAGGFQRGQQLFPADALRFRDLVNPLLSH